jgi:hypothetical protein
VATRKPKPKKKEKKNHVHTFSHFENYFSQISEIYSQKKKEKKKRLISVVI